VLMESFAGCLHPWCAGNLLLFGMSPKLSGESFDDCAETTRGAALGWSDAPQSLDDTLDIFALLGRPIEPFLPAGSHELSSARKSKLLYALIL